MDSTISILVLVYTHRDTQSRATRPCFLVYSKFHVPLCMRTVIWLCVQLTGFVSVQDFHAIQWWWVTFMSEVKPCSQSGGQSQEKREIDAHSLWTTPPRAQVSATLRPKGLDL